MRPASIDTPRTCASTGRAPHADVRRQDSGGDYRSLLGLPGGVNSSLYATVAEALSARPGAAMTLVPGQGSEGDTLQARTVLVMDSDRFPFHQVRLLPCIRS